MATQPDELLSKGPRVVPHDASVRVATQDSSDPKTLYGFNALGNMAFGAGSLVSPVSKKLVAGRRHPSLYSAGLRTRNLVLGGLAGAALSTPFDYLQSKAEERYRNDKDFNAKHFGAILLPALASGTLGTGVMMNTIDTMKLGNRVGTKKMVAGILSPKRNIKRTRREMGSIARAFRGKNIGGALLGALMLGSSLIGPAQYAYRTLRGKKDEELKKEASARNTNDILRSLRAIKNKLGKSAAGIDKKKFDTGLGYFILASGGLAAGESLRRKLRKQETVYPDQAVSKSMFEGVRVYT